MGSDRPVREAENRLERFNDEREVRGGDILLMGQQLFRVG